MADNYLENRYDEFFGPGKKKTVVKRVGQSLDTLLMKNRSHRGYIKNYVVTEEMLRKIVSVNNKIPSACNQQALRFKLVLKDTGSDKVLANIKMGAALPELHLPLPGTEPEAFIIICSTIPENRMLDVDLGISAQSMLLKAVEMGLNGLIIGAFNKENIKNEFSLPFDPMLIVAVGKGAETIQLIDIEEKEDHRYYRQDRVHYVPKVKVEQLILK